MFCLFVYWKKVKKMYNVKDCIIFICNVNKSVIIDFVVFNFYGFIGNLFIFIICVFILYDIL